MNLDELRLTELLHKLKNCPHCGKELVMAWWPVGEADVMVVKACPVSDEFGSAVKLHDVRETPYVEGEDDLPRDGGGRLPST